MVGERGLVIFGLVGRRVGQARSRREARDIGIAAAIGAAAGRVQRHVPDRRAEAADAVAAVPADRAEPLLEQAAAAVGDRGEQAEPAVEEGVGDQEGAARVPGIGEVVIAHLAARRHDEAAIVERAAGLQVDGRAERAFVHFRRRALAHGQPAEQLGGEHVEIEAAAAVGAARAVGAAGRRQRLELVEADAGEIGAEAAHRDRAAFAGVAVDRHAGNALQQFGEVLVGEVGDVLGDDDVDDAGVVALGAQRRGQRRAEAGDDDLVVVVRLVARRRLAEPAAPRPRPRGRRSPRPASRSRPSRRARMRARGVLSSFEIMSDPSKRRARDALPSLKHRLVTPVSKPPKKSLRKPCTIGQRCEMASGPRPFSLSQVPRLPQSPFPVSRRSNRCHKSFDPLQERLSRPPAGGP